MTARHEILSGKVQLYQRPRSPFWQCEATVGGQQFRKSTKTDSLAQAKDFAEDWYLTLKGKDRFGGGIEKRQPKGKLFREASQTFLDEYQVLTGGLRSEQYVDGVRRKIDKHLNPFFGLLGVQEISTSTIQDYRVHRAKNVNKKGEPAPPARVTMKHEIVILRHVLKTCLRHGWLTHLPDLTEPYRGNSKISHRAWFSVDEYRQLYRATRKRARDPLHPKWRWETEQFHDYVLFMANTGLRPDEAARLQFRDVSIVDDDITEERILEIEVRGKRGVGYCKSMPGAVRPFERLAARSRAAEGGLSKLTRDRSGKPAEGERRRYGSGMKRKRGHSGVSRGQGADMAPPSPTDLIFGPIQREMMNTVLDELGLKFDRDGQRRTAYSLRHTYICMRLMEGADIYQIAKNCRTSVEMIEKFYASHIKNILDASAINVRRPRPAQEQNLGGLSEEDSDLAAVA